MAGSNSGGKTTLARGLHDILGAGWGLVDYSRPTHAAIKMGKMSARDFKDVDMQTQWEFQVEALFEQIRAQNLAKLQYKNYVIDRSVFDYLAYLNDKLPSIDNTEHYKLYEKLVIENSKDYTHLFFVENNYNTKPDDNGIRLMDDPVIVGNELLKILKKYNVTYNHIKANTIEDRLFEALSILKM